MMGILTKTATVAVRMLHFQPFGESLSSVQTKK